MKMQDYKRKTEKIYRMPKSVQELIPIYRISEDGIFELENKPEGAKKLYDRAYLFEDANFTTLEEYEKEDYLELYRNMLCSLNASFKITIISYNRDMEQVRREAFLKCSDPRFRNLADSLNEQIRKSVLEGRAGSDTARLFIISCERENIEQARNYFRSLEANLMLGFHHLQSALIPLDASQRLRFLHSFYRMGEESGFHFDFREALGHKQDWKDFVAPTVIRHCQDEYGKFDGITLQIDGRYVRAFYLKDYPTKLEDTAIRKLTDGSERITLTIDAAAIPQEIVRKTLEQSYLQNERAIEKQQETRNAAHAWSSDISYDRRREKDDIEDTMDAVNEDGENMFYVGVFAVISSESPKALEKDCISFEQRFLEAKLQFAPARWNQLDVLNTALPTGARYCTDHMRGLFTRPLATMVPFVVRELYHPGGLYYGINQVSRNILIGDRKLLKNANGFVIAITGGGKSVCIKLEMIQVCLGTKDDIIIIDPQNEYRILTEFLGGQFVEFGSGAGNYINPLDTDTLEFMGKEKFLVDKTQLMCSIYTQITGEITAQERSLIGRCVKIVYEDTFRNLKKKTAAPTLKDFYRVMGEQEEELAQELKLSLEIFVNGALDMFAKETNVNTRNRLTTYGIADLGEEQSGIGMLIMLEGIRARIARNAKQGRATWLYIDEFHNMTSHQYTALFFEKIWKEVRKMGGICTAITQNIADCLSLKPIETMLCNSAYIALLSQSEVEMEVLRETLRINDRLLSYVQNTEPGCGLLKFGDGNFIPMDQRIPKDSELYRLINTNFHEMQRAKKKSRKAAEAAVNALPEEILRRMEEKPTDLEKISSL